MRKRLAILCVLVGGLIGVLALYAGAAHGGNGIECGQTLGPGGHYKLTHDLNCSSATGDFALKLIGPVKLNLGRHMVSADETKPPPNGVILEGKRAKLINGNITGGFGTDGDVGDQNRTELLLRGAGYHRVSRVTVRGLGLTIGAGGPGMLILPGSDHNLVTRSLFELMTGEGVWVRGDDNLLIRNVSRHNPEQGFDDGGNRNTWIRNTATENGFEGFRTRPTTSGARFLFNVATRNEEEGMLINSDNALLYRNTLKYNDQHGTFVAASATNNRVFRNIAIGNGRDGIRARGTGHLVKRNVALRNGDNSSYFDLHDTTGAPCTTITWRLNIFTTSNDPCIN